MNAMPPKVLLPIADHEGEVKQLHAFCNANNIDLRKCEFNKLLASGKILKEASIKGDPTRVVLLSDGKTVLKLVNLMQLPKFATKAQMLEVRIMANFAWKTPNLVPLVGLFFDTNSMQLGIAMEMMVTLEQKCAEMHQENQHCTPAAVANCLRQLLQGVHALAEFGFLHGDIKADNVLVTTDGNLVFKLSDFASAREITDQNACDVPEPVHLVGMYHPHDFKNAKNAEQAFDSRYDIWAVGILILRVLLCQHPVTLLARARELAMDHYTYTILLRQDSLNIVQELHARIAQYVKNDVVLNVLQNMLQCNWDKRYTAKLALETLGEAGTQGVRSLSQD
tara:strand:+ start:1199 stop:2209 length:1011 start_codon:yes stop_codon:yes gene_type:complete